MDKDKQKTREQLDRELDGMRRRVADLEALTAGDWHPIAKCREEAQGLAAVSQLAIDLASAAPDANLFEQIGEGLKSIAGTLATGVTTYDPQTQELTIRYVASNNQMLSKLHDLLGQDLLDMRVPTSPELRDQMLARVIWTADDLTALSLGVVDKSFSAAVRQVLGTGMLVGLSIHHDLELLGAAVMVMPREQVLPSSEVLRLFANLAAVSLRRKRAEEALRDSEEQYRTLIETSPDGIALLDLDAQVTMVNQALVHAYGATSTQELVGLGAFELLAPEDRQRARERWPGFSEIDASKGAGYRLLRKDGSSYPSEISSALIRDGSGEPRGVLNVIRDVSEREQMEAALQKRNRALEHLNRAGQALNASLDLDQVFDMVVEQVCDLVGVEACSVWLVEPESGELVCHCANGPHEVIVRGWRLAKGQGLAGWVVQSGESLLISDAQSEERHYRGVQLETGWALHSILSVPLRIKEDVIGVLQVLDTGVDRLRSTELVLVESLATSAAIALENARLYKDQKERMEELRRTQAQLVQSANMAAVGELAAGVAHELNNPLTSVLGFSELLLERQQPDERDQARLETIVRQARRARNIVRNLLSFAQQTEFLREWADLNHVVQETLSLQRQRMETSGIVIAEKYDPDLPLLLLDATRMRQVFLNLFTNALYAMPQGGTLTVQVERVGDRAAVRIRDTGEGIPEEYLPRIFEPFFTTRPVGEGTGLGLSVSVGIVQDHGGRIEVDSQVGEGSTFVVWLPLEEDGWI